MPLLLRVDVDKPYGNSNIFFRCLSKLNENYSFFNFTLSSYLHHFEDFINVINKENIPSFIYFRNCTVPSKKYFNLNKLKNHKIGFHAENTKSLNTLKNELDEFKIKLDNKIISFTKHGSGQIKLGKNHYYKYEPNKYLEWSQKLNMKFYFGNGIIEKVEDLYNENYFPNMFWMHKNYRSQAINSIDKILEISKTHIIPILIHPSNFQSNFQVRSDFLYLIQKSKEFGIEWLKDYEKNNSL